MKHNWDDELRYDWPRERKCAECGKIFAYAVPAEEWPFKIRSRDGNHTFFCSWSCLRKRELRTEQQQKEEKRLREKADLVPKRTLWRIYKYFDADMTNAEICKEEGLEADTIAFMRKRWANSAAHKGRVKKRQQAESAAG